MIQSKSLIHDIVSFPITCHSKEFNHNIIIIHRILHNTYYKKNLKKVYHIKDYCVMFECTLFHYSIKSESCAEFNKKVTYHVEG